MINYHVGMDVSAAFLNKNNQVIYVVGQKQIKPDIDKIYTKGLDYSETSGIFTYSDGSYDYGEEVVELTIAQKIGGDLTTKTLWFRTNKLEIYGG